MSVPADEHNLFKTAMQLMEPACAQAMIQNQKKYINAAATVEIGDFIEHICRCQRQETAQPFFPALDDAQMVLT